MGGLYELIRELWVLWLLAIFVGIVAWAYWPRNRKRFEEHGKIPLQDGTRGGTGRKDEEPK